ncbi:type III secretion system export apparatus subunit SctT [Bordetella muralis]|uniref:type III secretion system export apparatus subunit SctT n=1 Tax=Bordetella muralis TaxID=1649130 RepID=UPI0039EF9A56
MNESSNQLIALLATYLPTIQGFFTLCVLASLRFLTAFYIFPPLGDTFLTGYLRNSLVGLLSIFVAVGTPVEAMQTLAILDLAVLAIKEAVIGLLIGFASAQVFWIASSVGALLDMLTGYNDVQTKNPLSGEQSTPISQFLLHLVTVIFYTTGGMLFFLGVVFQSYQLWPLFSNLPQLGNASSPFVLSQINGLMTGIVKFGAPVLLVLILIEFSFGLLNRAAGQLGLSNLSQPVKGAVTLLMLALLISTIIPQIQHLLVPTGLLQEMKRMMDMD